MEQTIRQNILTKLQSGDFLIADNNPEGAGYYCHLDGRFLIVSEGVNGYIILQ